MTSQQKAVAIDSGGEGCETVPEEVADLMAFPVSPAEKWLTGTCERIDGGEIRGI